MIKLSLILLMCMRFNMHVYIKYEAALVIINFTIQNKPKLMSALQPLILNFSQVQI